MAIQTQQSSTKLAGMWRTMVVAAGMVGVGATFVVGGLGWQQAAKPQVELVAQPVMMRHVPLGVDVPAGVDVQALPQGYRDYIRAEAPVVPVVEAQPQVLGIELPASAELSQLPTGLTDYIRQTWPGLLPAETRAHPGLGVDLPAGAQVAELPAGLTDYLRDRSGVRATIALAAPVMVTNPALGVDAPVGVDAAALPQGYRDYIRTQEQAPQATNHPFGTDAPAGVDLSTLPTGYTDYIRGSR
jgi:hypothetical protein